MKKIPLGATAKDSITGFEGVVVGHCEYLTGCDQLLITPTKCGPDGATITAHWFDAQRMTQVGDDVIAFDNSKTPGCDIPAPIC